MTVPVTETDPNVAVSVTATCDVTVAAVAVNHVALAPDDTKADAGTERAGLLLFIVSVTPLGPAGPVRYTNTVKELPPVTAGATETDESAGGTMVQVPDFFAFPI